MPGHVAWIEPELDELLEEELLDEELLEDELLDEELLDDEELLVVDDELLLEDELLDDALLPGPPHPAAILVANAIPINRIRILL